MDIGSFNVFQTDSVLVNNAYREQLNYLVEEDTITDGRVKVCAIYFASNELYYPNTDAVFERCIIKENKFEWYKCRVNEATKHIFIRDVKKQWYLEGINAEINSIEKLFRLLVDETKGYKVVTIGSSAGGFAAVLLGSMLSAIRIYSFNGQFMLSDLLTSSSELINPTVFRRRNQPEFNQYYSLRRYITNADRIFYFVSQKSEWDYRQFEHVASLNINTFFFNTSHHGIPFIKDALPVVINLPSERLTTRKNKMLNPILFSVSFIGIIGTFLGLYKQLKKKYKW